MRTILSFLAMSLAFGCTMASPCAAAKDAKAPTRASAAGRVYDAAADRYKLEQRARLVYWVYSYRQSLAALRQGRIEPVHPYSRQPLIDELFKELSPGAQAYARKLQALEKRTMAKQPAASLGDRSAITRGILAILEGLYEEQKVLERMPVHY